jgi:hypothetical protein
MPVRNDTQCRFSAPAAAVGVPHAPAHGLLCDACESCCERPLARCRRPMSDDLLQRLWDQADTEYALPGSVLNLPEGQPAPCGIAMEALVNDLSWHGRQKPPAHVSTALRAALLAVEVRSSSAMGLQLMQNSVAADLWYRAKVGTLSLSGVQLRSVHLPSSSRG